MFDEPSLGLAPNIVEQVFAIIGSIRKSVTTVPMVEQNAYSALPVCSRPARLFFQARARS